ncbi:MAG: NADH-quinone oxidoreductase subunit NuoB [Candidatus Caldarchaeum sp.]|nr:NADH-quinone oxidoreductase subunit NuoB [Candidatus Caldarchaeum sp.]
MFAPTRTPFPGHYKTGNFGYRFADSKSIVSMVEETKISPKKIDETIARYGVGKVHKKETSRGLEYFLYRFRDFRLIRFLLNWGRMASLFPAHITTACCSVEFAATHSPRYDPERFGWLPATGSLRQSDVVVVEGTVTSKMALRLRLVYDQMPDPKWVIAMGACAISGGLYAKDSYNVIQGVDDILPVDVYVPGCPPRPETLFQGILLLREKILYGKVM